MKRNTFAAASILLTAIFGVSIYLSHAYASQIPISASGGSPAPGEAGSWGSCYPASSLTGTTSPAPLMVWSDSTDHAITGNYILQLPDCTQYTGATNILCNSVSEA